jgi:hypothetical protein
MQPGRVSVICESRCAFRVGVLPIPARVSACVRPSHVRTAFRSPPQTVTNAERVVRSIAHPHTMSFARSDKHLFRKPSMLKCTSVTHGMCRRRNLRLSQPLRSTSPAIPPPVGCHSSWSADREKATPVQFPSKFKPPIDERLKTQKCLTADYSRLRCAWFWTSDRGARGWFHISVNELRT